MAINGKGVCVLDHHLLKYMDVFGRNVLFCGIEPDDTEKILDCTKAELCEYEKNTIMFERGTVMHQVVLLLEGHMKTVYNGVDRPINFAEKLGASECFGTAFCVTGTPLHLDLLATQDCTAALLSSYRLFKPCHMQCPAHVKVVHNVINSLAEKGVALSRKIDYMHIRTLEGTLAAYLIDQMELSHHEIFTVNLNQTELADFFGVSRTSLARELTRMREKGLVEYHGKTFRLLDVQRLRDILQKS